MHLYSASGYCPTKSQCNCPPKDCPGAFWGTIGVGEEILLGSEIVDCKGAICDILALFVIAVEVIGTAGTGVINEGAATTCVSAKGTGVMGDWGGDAWKLVETFTDIWIADELIEMGAVWGT